MLDVLKNDMSVIISPYRPDINAPYEEEVERGYIESLMESKILNQITGQTSTGIGEVLGSAGRSEPAHSGWPHYRIGSVQSGSALRHHA